MLSMIIRNIITYIVWGIVMAFIYMILREDISLITFIIGLSIGICTIIVCILFFKKTFIIRYSIKVLPLIWYFINLVVLIVSSSIKSFYWGLYLQTFSTLITYESSLKDDMLITLLANSITLTPGTITIDKTNNTLKFMRLCKENCPLEIKDIKRLERLLLSVEVSKK